MEHQRRETYRKHQIKVEASETSTGWGWSYLIDGKISGQSRHALCADAEAALRQGTAAAQARVDELER